MRVRRKFQDTSVSERASFVLMRACGMSLSAIARATGVSVSTVFKWTQRWLQEGSINSKPCKKKPLEAHEVADSAGTTRLSTTWMNYTYSYPVSYEHQRPLHYTQGYKIRIQPLSSVYRDFKWHTNLNQCLIFLWINHYQRSLQMTETKYLPLILEHMRWRIHYTNFLFEKNRENDEENRH